MRSFLLALAALAILAPAAQAGTVTLDDANRTLIYAGDAGPNDVDVFVTLFEGVYTIRVRDFTADSTTTSPNCEVDSAGDVECERNYAPVEKLYGGAGDDTVETSSATFVPAGHVADGQEGNDQVDGGPHAETLIGGPGNDELSSDGGPTFSGLPPSPNDVLIGGDGIDEVTYQQGTGQSYSLTLDGVANDGAPGENDNIASDVENLTGNLNRDSVLVGNDGPNRLLGLDGDNTLDGRGGNDVLTGRDGNDVLDGGAGDDALEGGADDDRLTGGPGRDTFSADFSGSSDQIFTGNDAIFARDGVAEPVTCGPGADTAQVDADDVVAADGQNGCETVDRPVVTGGGGAGGGSGGGPGAPAASVSVRSSSLRVRANRIGVSIACPAGGPGCVGTVRVRTASRVRLGKRRTTAVLAQGSYSIAAGAKRTLRLKVGRTGRTVLRRSRKLRVRVELRAPGARNTVATRTVTLRR